MPPRKRKRKAAAADPAAQPEKSIPIQASATVGQAEGSQVTGAVVNAPDAQHIQIGDIVAGDKNVSITHQAPEQTITNQASNIGAQGIFNAPVYVGTTPPTTPALHQLRAPVGDFVGREQEIAQLVQAARRGTVAAISGVRGMGGIGKTELAYVVAHQLAADFPDAQIVVELRGAGDPLSPIQALQSLIRAFEPERRLPDDLAELQALYRSLLTGRRVLVLADDARDATQVRPLLPPAGSTLLITSRWRFTLPGMDTIDLGTLAPTEAVDLLLAICPRIGEAAPVLAKLCVYLPLALRVSASLLANDATLPVARYLGQLEDERTRLAALHDGEDVALNVDASLALSYVALDRVGQATLCQLSVFVADFDLGAVQAIVMLEGEQLLETVLGDLYRRSLLDYDTTQERYSLHELVRVFAHARLDAGAIETLMLRYAQHYERIARQAQSLYVQGGESVLIGLGLFDRERAHIDAGWAFLLGQEAGSTIDEVLITYAGATAHIGELRYDRRREWIPQLEAALAAAVRRGQHAVQSMALNNLGLAYAALGEVRRAIAYHEQDLVIAREIGDRRGESYTLGNLGLAYAALGEVQQAIDNYERVLKLAREMGDRQSEGKALGNLGNAYYALGEVRRAIDYFEQDLELAREMGDRRGEGQTLGNLGNAYYALGEVRRAIEHYEQDLVIAREIGDRHGEGIALGKLGNGYRALGEVRRAIEYLEQDLVIAREIGDRRGEGQTLGNLGIAYYSLGEVRQAIKYHEQQLLITRAIDDRGGEGRALGNLGNAYAALDDTQQAINCYEQRLAIARAIGDRQGEVLGSWNMGRLFAKQGDLAQAIALMQIRVDFERTIGHTDAEANAAVVEELRRQLPPEGATSPNEQPPA